MKVLVCGDRWYDNPVRLQWTLDVIHGKVGRITQIIEGCAPGADSLAEAWAESKHVPVRHFPADWKKYGKAAGPIRNREMLDQQPHLVVIFHDAIQDSRGSRDTWLEARQRNIPTMLITGGDPW